MTMHATIRVLLSILMAGWAGASPPAPSEASAVNDVISFDAGFSFSRSKAAAGQKTYDAVCANCHGFDLSGEWAPPLKGPLFVSNWEGKSARSLYTRIITTMPVSDPGSLSETSVEELVVFILSQSNGASHPISSADGQLESRQDDRSASGGNEK